MQNQTQSTVPCMTRYRNGSTTIMLLNVNSQLAPNGPRLFLLLWYRICAKAIIPNDLVRSPFSPFLTDLKFKHFKKKNIDKPFLILVNSFYMKNEHCNSISRYRSFSGVSFLLFTMTSYIICYVTAKMLGFQGFYSQTSRDFFAFVFSSDLLV